MAVECVIAAGFFGVAIAGFRIGLWLVAAGVVAHGLFDFAHHWIVDNPGVPPWWPGFCLAVDVTLGLWLALQCGGWAPKQSRLEGTG